jgi:hypothetical protein
MGHSRRTEEPQRFAECPLCFHQRRNLCVATKRREGPLGDIDGLIVRGERAGELTLPQSSSVFGIAPGTG